MIGFELSTKKIAIIEVMIILIRKSQTTHCWCACFFIWLCGPSSRMLCPNFIRFSVGIKIGTKIKVINSAITASIKA